MSAADIEQVRALLARYGDGDGGVIERLIAPAYFTYEPGDDEPTATETYASFAAEFKAAAPDLRVDIPDLAWSAESEGWLAGEAVISGTWSGELWGAAPSGEVYTFRVPVTLRPIGDAWAVRVDMAAPAALAILRELHLVNPPDQMHLPAPQPIMFDDLLIKVLFTGQVADRPCAHLDEIQVTRSDAIECDDCGTDDIWPALRMCLLCGHVGCCDTSTNKHAKMHWEQTGHPLIRSLRLDEGWLWCYEDDAVFQKRTLAAIQARLDRAA